MSWMDYFLIVVLALIVVVSIALIAFRINGL
jgi:hypothetical protein